MPSGLSNPNLSNPSLFNRRSTVLRGLTVAAGMAAIALVAACSTSGSAPQSDLAASLDPDASQTVTTSQPRPTGLTRLKASARIALLLPTSASGQTGLIAKNLKQAAELALFDFEDADIQLITKDTQGTPEGALAAAQAAIDANADVIVGPLFAKSVRAVAPLATGRGIPVLAFSSDATVAQPGVHLLSFQAHQEIDRIVAHAVERGMRTFAGLIPNDAYGKIMEREFRDAVQRRGAQILALETYAPGASGMLQTSQKLFETVAGAQELGTPVDALFVPGDASTLPTLGPIIGYTKVDTTRIKLLGNGGWDFPNLGRHKAYIGGWFAAAEPGGFSAFSQKFAATFGSAPPRVSSLAYDGISIVATLAQRAGPGRKLDPRGLLQPSGFAGVDGPIRFLPDGRTERALAVLEVHEFGANVVDPAPRSFAAPAASQSANNAKAGSGGGGFGTWFQ